MDPEARHAEEEKLAKEREEKMATLQAALDEASAELTKAAKLVTAAKQAGAKLSSTTEEMSVSELDALGVEA